ncbi:MAG: type II toxin-antitoxin system Phd/YefM family antitoxin [Armatimonadetes bacterium]|nr:type II toxin-antitoxin system Phd/YefM family antitoxin [Armatimonadota bacterium]
MIKATNIHSVTDFTRNAKTYIQIIRETKSPMALTVNGDAQVVVQDAETFQKMVDELDRVRFIAAMRESERAVQAGEVQGVEEACADIKKELTRLDG